MTIYIEGFGLGNYRSFNELQYIGPFKKINIIIGQNNSGKSNIVNFLAKHYSDTISSKYTRSKTLEIYDDFRSDNTEGYQKPDIHFSLGIKKGGKIYYSICNRSATQNTGASPTGILSLRTLLENQVFYREDEELIWFDFLETGDLSNMYFEHLNEVFSFSEWRTLWIEVTGQTGGDFDRNWKPESINALIPYPSSPTISLIPCQRSIRSTEGTVDHDIYLDGNHIISKISELQNADFHEDDKRARFEQINQFVQELTGDSSAKLEIPNHGKTINVFMNNKRLQIGHLGSGIEQVIIIAAAATALDKQVVCIEEPELYLHPTLQRRLIRYLSETGNQYFITTHSAHILDAPDVEIFHVELINAESKVTRVTDDLKRLDICKDLGYKASDILQANCIVWVEGPSDRIYINYWISQLAPELKEGLHYSVMFYGGKLLSSLSASDDDLEEFISLHRLNQNMAILMDSDLSKAEDEIRATKVRIKEEFEDRNCIVWVTAGREIENYIDKLVMSIALETVTNGDSTVPANYNQYSRFYKKGNNKTDPSKVDIAKKVIANNPTLEILDLKEKLEELVEYIKGCN